MEASRSYDNFLKSLKAALTNITVYFKEHPIFVKAVEDLKLEIDKIFSTDGFLKIGITADSLQFNNQPLKENRLYQDTAKFFHLRKIKNIEIEKEVRVGELTNFLIEASLSPRDILARGGLNNILKKGNISHIRIKDLDYSGFLEGEGKENVDIWLYLLDESLTEDNSERLEELAGRFPAALSSLDVKELVSDDKKRETLDKFLNYLKNKNQDQFSANAKGLARSILENKGSFDEDSINKLKEFLRGVSAEGISEVLLEELESGKSMDALSLDLFSRLFNREKHGDIATSLAGKLSRKDNLRNDPALAKEIKELFSLPNSPYVSEIYRRNLSAIIKEVPAAEGVNFDSGQLQNNYRFMLLDLLVLELDRKKFAAILDKALNELGMTPAEESLSYICSFTEILEKKRSLFKAAVQKATQRISFFIEKIVLEEGVCLDSKYLDILKTSALAPEDYLNKIFTPQKFRPIILQLYFKLFPQNLEQFYVGLDEAASDIILVRKILENLHLVEVSFSLDILKHIFYSANMFMKVEALKVMKSLPSQDRSFLLAVLKDGNFLERQEAVQALLKNPAFRKETAALLLNGFNLFGVRSRIIKENLQILEGNPFKEAGSYLYRLSKRRFFWNRAVRKKAAQVLEKSDVWSN